MLLMNTGCRVGGLIGLTLDRLDIDKGTAVVIEKGDKARPVFFAEPTATALREWLTVRNSSCANVFVNNQGQSMSVHAVAFVLQRLKRRSGVTGRVNAHAFRHAFARRYVENGGDTSTLADLLGHADPSITRAYLVFRTDELRRQQNLRLNFAGLVEHS